MDRPLLAAFWLIFRAVLVGVFVWQACLQWNFANYWAIGATLFFAVGAAFFVFDTVMCWREIAGRQR